MTPAQVQCLAAVPVGEQPKVPNLDEADRQGMEQEAADELVTVKSHRAASVVVARVAQRKLTCPFSRLMSLPLEMATRWV